MTAARLCLACRHALPDGAACDQPGHEALALDPPGRARLQAEVWGGAPERLARIQARLRRQRRAATVGVGSGVAAGVGTAALIGGIGPLVLLGGLLVGGVAAGLADLVRRGDRDPAWPRGAAPIPPAAPFARGTIVDAGEDARSPASGLWAAGWALELTLIRPDGARVVFRDAATAGLEIELDGGARARVPAGPWRPAGGLVPLLDVDEAAVHAHLRQVDPLHRDHDEASPFHHDAVHEALLAIGDRVELCGGWRPVPDPGGAADPLYRDAPASVLVADGWPSLRRVK